MTMHERAVDAAMEIECKKDRLAQNQDGTWKLTLTVAPDGLPDAVMKASPGIRYRAFFVEVDDQEEPVKHAPAPSERPRERFVDKRLSAQAGIRCADPRFWKFIYEYDQSLYEGIDANGDVEAAAEFVRQYCGVDSRRDLDNFTAAGGTWTGLNAEFEEWSGQVAEAR